MTFTVDVHHHILPDFFWAATNEGRSSRRGDSAAPLVRRRQPCRSSTMPASTSPSPRSARQECIPVTTQRHASWPGAATSSQRNWCSDHPDRFGGFACLPLPDVDGSLEELRYALDVLHLDGVVLFSNALGVYLGDHRLDATVRRTADAERPWCSSTPTRRPTLRLTLLACPIR